LSPEPAKPVSSALGRRSTLFFVGHVERAVPEIEETPVEEGTPGFPSGRFG
jgi:hypothetical protein